MSAEEEKNTAAAGREKNAWQKDVLMYLHDLVYLLAAIMICFVLLFRIVVVSGPSMYTTLWDGDWLLVIGNIFYREPEAGDIVIAAKDAFNHGEPIVKRVIATEGQTVDIDFELGVVYVDGVALDEPYTNTPTNMQEGMHFPLEVEKGCVFVMGDNRNSSKDSRNPEIGLIDRREILGKALFLLFPGTHEHDAPRDYSRIGVLN